MFAGVLAQEVMKLFYLGVIAGGALMCGSPGVAAAATQIHTTAGASIWQVDSQAQQPSQRGGIVNERSTGNEPFMGPGASGGPTQRTRRDGKYDQPAASEQAARQFTGQRTASLPTFGIRSHGARARLGE